MFGTTSTCAAPIRGDRRLFERMLGAQVIRTMQQGKPRIDLELGGAMIFIAPVAPGEGVNAPPTTPYQGLDHFGLAVSGIDAVAAELKAKGVEFTKDVTTIRPARASASCAVRRAYRSSSWSATRSMFEAVTWAACSVSDCAAW